VNSSAVFLALLSFQLWLFSVKEFLAIHLELKMMISCLRHTATIEEALQMIV